MAEQERNFPVNGMLILAVILSGIVAGMVLLAGVPVLPGGSPAVCPDIARFSASAKNLNDTVILDTGFPRSPVTAPVYRVTSKDSIFEDSPKSMEIKTSIPSTSEAVPLAKEALKKYGGLPEDAVLAKVEQVTMKKYNLTSGLAEAQYPQWTQVIFDQRINGSPVIGPGAEITIGLGENGELLFIEKAWRHLAYDRDVPIITAEQAFDKLKRGELLETPQSAMIGLHITKIELGYYAEHREKEQKTYTPVWIFYGTHDGSSSKEGFPYLVDAVK